MRWDNQLFATREISWTFHLLFIRLGTSFGNTSHSHISPLAKDAFVSCREKYMSFDLITSSQIRKRLKTTAGGWVRVDWCFCFVLSAVVSVWRIGHHQSLRLWPAIPFGCTFPKSCPLKFETQLVTEGCFLVFFYSIIWKVSLSSKNDFFLPPTHPSFLRRKWIFTVCQNVDFQSHYHSFWISLGKVLWFCFFADVSPFRDNSIRRPVRLARELMP